MFQLKTHFIVLPHSELSLEKKIDPPLGHGLGPSSIVRSLCGNFWSYSSKFYKISEMNKILRAVLCHPNRQITR